MNPYSETGPLYYPSPVPGEPYCPYSVRDASETWVCATNRADADRLADAVTAADMWQIPLALLVGLAGARMLWKLGKEDEKPNVTL